MCKRKLRIIIMLMIVLIILGGCSDQKPTTTKENADKGMMNLAQLDLENEVVCLDGQWEFYWNQLLAPGEASPEALTGYIQIPGSWNKYIENEEQSGYGYATYRLLYIAEENERLAFKIPRLFTSYKFWVNGELIATAGKWVKPKTL